MDYAKDLLRAGTQKAGNIARCTRDTVWRCLMPIVPQNLWTLCLKLICVCGHLFAICKQMSNTFALMLYLRMHEIPMVNYVVENYTWLLIVLLAVIYYILNLLILRVLHTFKGLPHVFLPLIGKLLKALPQKTGPAGSAGTRRAGTGGAGTGAGAGRAGVGTGAGNRAANNTHQVNGGNVNGNAQPAGTVDSCLPRRNPDRFARKVVPTRYSP